MSMHFSYSDTSIVTMHFRNKSMHILCIYMCQAYQLHLQSHRHVQQALVDSMGGKGGSLNAPEMTRADGYTCTVCNIDMDNEAVSTGANLVQMFQGV